MDALILCIITGTLISMAWSLDKIVDLLEKKK